MPRPLLWTSIADSLRAEVAAGHYGPGDKLPTEAALSQRFGVNRHTVRRALAALIEEGRVVTRRGAGAFVATTPTDYPLGRRTRFTQNMLAAGRSPTRRWLALETRSSDAREAEALALETGTQIHVCEGLSLVDDTAVGLFRSVFPADRFPRLLENLRDQNSITGALRAEGLPDYTRAWTRLTAKLATPTQAGLLQIAANAPILRSVAVNVDGAGQPVEYGRTWFAGDRMTLTLTPDDP